jgi:hypothetical protein
MKQRETSQEYQRLDQTMRELMKVPHSEINAKLDEENATKAKKPRQLNKIQCH